MKLAARDLIDCCNAQLRQGLIHHHIHLVKKNRKEKKKSRFSETFPTTAENLHYIRHKLANNQIAISFIMYYGRLTTDTLHRYLKQFEGVWCLSGFEVFTNSHKNYFNQGFPLFKWLNLFSPQINSTSPHPPAPEDKRSLV